MSRTVLNVVDLAENDIIALTDKYDEVDATNGMIIEDAYKGTKNDLIFIKVCNTADANKNITVKKGAFPRAFADLKKSVAYAVEARDTYKMIGPFESARFKQADGSILIDFDAGFTGYIAAFRIKK